MTCDRPWLPRRARAAPDAPGSLSDPSPPKPHPRERQLEFARLVRLRLVTARYVAIVICGGKAAFIASDDHQYESWRRDYPLVGTYTPTATVTDIMDDLEAAGL